MVKRRNGVRIDNAGNPSVEVPNNTSSITNPDIQATSSAPEGAPAEGIVAEDHDQEAAVNDVDVETSEEDHEFEEEFEGVATGKDEEANDEGVVVVIEDIVWLENNPKQRVYVSIHTGSNVHSAGDMYQSIFKVTEFDKQQEFEDAIVTDLVDDGILNLDGVRYVGWSEDAKDAFEKVEAYKEIDAKSTEEDINE